MQNRKIRDQGSGSGVRDQGAKGRGTGSWVRRWRECGVQKSSIVQMFVVFRYMVAVGRDGGDAGGLHLYGWPTENRTPPILDVGELHSLGRSIACG